MKSPSWNYRVIKYKDSEGYGLHEVYYDEDGLPWGMGTEPARFIAAEDGRPKRDIYDALSRAARDLDAQPVLVEPDVWPGRHP